ncbi:hypothetical protein [Streptomyces sp. NPDC059783]|uniref:hypothetical protein n=1 Tax=Streptomyces sp. NPDC059783 TaxID=3346944 RepID=UPI003647E052
MPRSQKQTAHCPWRQVRAHGSRTATEYLLGPLAGDVAAVERLRRVADLAGGVR